MVGNGPVELVPDKKVIWLSVPPRGPLPLRTTRRGEESANAAPVTREKIRTRRIPGRKRE